MSERHESQHVKTARALEAKVREAEEGRQRQVRAMVSARLSGLMAAGGVSHSVASQEVLFLLPEEFTDRYEELFDAALKLDSGSHTGQGVRQGELGKAPADSALPGTTKGLRHDSGVESGMAPHIGAGGKRYKNTWTVRDDAALELKLRIDKRLRGIARNIREALGEGATSGRGVGVDQGSGVTGASCEQCGRRVAAGWKFCPNDGSKLDEHDEHDG